ncbi:MAG TPA: hypothetical protein VGJ79_08300 [Candidatus Dormibacteraeota bacterium]
MLILIGIAVGTILIRLPSLTEPRWYFDEGVFTTVAWATSKGLPLYSSVYDLQPPGIYWLYQLIIALGAGEHHFVAQIAGALFAVATAVLTFVVSMRFMPLRPAALAGAMTGFVLCIPTLDGDLLNVELAALPFFLAGLLLAFSRRWPLIAASGALVGVAVVIRPSFVFDSLALLIPLLGGGQRVWRLVLAGAGAAAALGAAALALAIEGSLATYLSLVVPSDHTYALAGNGGTFTPMFVRLVVLGVVSVIFLIRAKTERGRLLAVWLPASLAGSSLTPLEYTHFFHEAAPALAFAIALRVSGFRWRWHLAPQAALALVIFSEAVLILPSGQTAVMESRPPQIPLRHNFGYWDLPAYYANWFAFASGLRSQSQYEQWFNEVGRQDAESSLLHHLARSSSDHLLVLGGRPWLYVESGMLPATRYVTVCNASCIVPSEITDVRSSLMGDCAYVVVAVSQLPYWQGDLNADGYVAVDGAAWPTFRSSRPAGQCAPG